jgi:GxxExxY protein
MSRKGLIEEPLTHSVIGSFYEVYNVLRFGFLENLYALALERELKEKGHTVLREAEVSIDYKGSLLGIQRVDMLVDDRLIVEIKSTAVLPLTAKRQLYSYLKGSGLPVGLLLHFGPEARFYRLVAGDLGSLSEELREDHVESDLTDYADQNGSNHATT